MSAPQKLRKERARDKRALTVGVALLVAAGAVAGLTFASGGADEEGVEVRAVEAQAGSVVSRVRAQGRLKAREEAHVGSELSGRVAAVFVEEGDRLKPGDPLFALDDQQQRNAVAQLEVAQRSARALLERAELVLAEAERSLARDERLREKNVISQEQVLASRARIPLARADVRSAQASVDRTRLDLDRARDALAKTRVVSPIAGTVVAVGLEVGQVVAPVGAGLSTTGSMADLSGGMPAAGKVGAEIVVADLSELVAELEIDELDIARVEVGQKAQIRVQGDARQVLDGRVEHAGLYGRETGGAVSFEVTAAVERPGARAGVDGGSPSVTLPTEGPPSASRLRPGMTVTAEIEVEKLDDTVLIPLAAVLEANLAQGEESDRVFLIDEVGERRVARRRQVVLGPTEDDRVAILHGLRGGELLVAGPYRALRELQEGDPVRIEEREELAVDAEPAAGERDDDEDKASSAEGATGGAR